MALHCSGWRILTRFVLPWEGYCKEVMLSTQKVKKILRPCVLQWTSLHVPVSPTTPDGVLKKHFLNAGICSISFWRSMMGCPTCSTSKTHNGSLCSTIYSQVCENKDEGFYTTVPLAIIYLYLYYFTNLLNYLIDPICTMQTSAYKQTILSGFYCARAIRALTCHHCNTVCRRTQRELFNFCKN